jgi:hypothetical protein
LVVANSVADPIIDPGQFVILGTQIEGYDLLPFYGRVCTLSFWAYSIKAGTYCISLRNNPTAPDRSYILEYTLPSNIWTYVTKTFTMNDGASGTWQKTNGGGLQIWFMLANGAQYQGPPNQWLTGNFLTTVNQCNFVDSATNSFFITGIQLELGSVATPFEVLPFAEELAICQRYYEKINYSSGGKISTGQAFSASSGSGALSFLPKRTAGGIVEIGGPIVALISNGTVAGGTIALSACSEQSLFWDLSGASGLSVGAAVTLIANGNGSFISIDAEF